MANLLGTTGGYLLPLGLPGSAYSSSPRAINTWVNEAVSGGLDSAGTIDFGVAVAKGTADNGCVPFTSSSQRVIGITSRMPLMPATAPGNIIGYQSNRALGVYRLGDVVVIAAEAVSEGDQVVALTTPYTGNTIGTSNLGSIHTGAASSSRVLLANHRWKTSAAQGGLAVIEVIAGEQMVTS